MARPPLPWDPSDTRGIDADPSCLHHALALAYHFHLLISYFFSVPRRRPVRPDLRPVVSHTSLCVGCGSPLRNSTKMPPTATLTTKTRVRSRLPITRARRTTTGMTQVSGRHETEAGERRGLRAELARLRIESGRAERPARQVQ